MTETCVGLHCYNSYYQAENGQFIRDGINTQAIWHCVISNICYNWPQSVAGLCHFYARTLMSPVKIKARLWFID